MPQPRYKDDSVFPLKALQFLDDPADFQLYTAREKEAKQALSQLEAVRAVLSEERQRACTLLEESKDRMLHTLVAVFAAEQRRTMQFYYQLEVQLQLVAAEFAAYLSDKSFRLSPLAQAATNRCKVKTSPMLRVEVNDYIADLPKCAGRWIWKSERPADEIVLGIFDKTERRKQFYELFANAETLAKSGYFPSMTLAAHHYEGLKNQIRFEKKNLQSLEADLEVKKTEMMETVKEILSADNPSVHTLIAKYQSRMKSRGVTAEGKAALLDDMLQFLRFHSDSSDTATLFTDLAKQFDHDQSKQIYLLNLSYSILKKHSSDGIAIAEVLEKLGALFSKISPKQAEQCYNSAICTRLKLNNEDPILIEDCLALGDIQRRSEQYTPALDSYDFARKLQVKLRVPLREVYQTCYKHLKTLSFAQAFDIALGVFSVLGPIMEEFPADALTAKCCILMSTVLANKGAGQDALKLAQTAAGIVAQFPDCILKARVMGVLGTQLQLVGELEQAVPVLSEAFRMYQSDSSQANQTFYVGFNLGNAYRLVGDDEAATNVFLESLKCGLQEGNNMWLMETYNSLGSIYSDSGAFEDAENCFQCCIRMAENTQAAEFLGVTARSSLAQCYERKGQKEDAERLYLSLIETLKEKYPQLPTIAQVKGNLATLYSNTNRAAEAKQVYEEALQELNSTQYPIFSAWLHYCYSRLLVENGISAVEDHLVEALRLWKQAKVPESAEKVVEMYPYPEEEQQEVTKQGSLICYNRQVEVHEFLGSIYSSKKQRKQAEKHWRKALRIYQKQGRTERVEAVLQCLQMATN